MICKLFPVHILLYLIFWLFKVLGRFQTAITNTKAANFLISLGQANILMRKIPAFFKELGLKQKSVPISKCTTGLFNKS